MKPIPSFSRYRATEDGRIYSTLRRRFLSSDQPGSRGYPMVAVTDDAGRQRCCLVHVLVALAHLGPRPPDHDVDHIDGNRLNNAVTNLRYLRSCFNRQQGKCRLTEEAVEDIRSQPLTAARRAAFAKHFGVRPETVGRVYHRQTWKEN